jgi:uncharacterized protein with HEPN domain
MGSWDILTSEYLEPTVSDRFGHIISAIEHVEECLHGLSQQQFARDQVLPLAFERLFEIISLATDYIPPDIKNADAAVDWKGLADLGGRLENASDRIETDILWDVAKHKLGPLKQFAKRHIAA